MPQLRLTFPFARLERPLSLSPRRERPSVLAGAALFLASFTAAAQSAPNPAGTDAAVSLPAQAVQTQPDIPAKQRREADDAYLKGARALERNDLVESELDFTRATKLNPLNREYALALAVAREHRLTDLVQRAAHERQLGHAEDADKLLLQAREIDPQNAIVLQHFSQGGARAPAPARTPEDEDPVRAARAADSLSLSGPVQLTPQPGTHSFHVRCTARDLLNQIAAAYGLRATLSENITAGAALRFDLDNADFASALRTAETVTHTFSVPLQPTELFFSHDTPEDRAQYLPLVEETLYMPGTSAADMTEYANLARNIFNLKVVNAVSNSGSLVLRGDEDTLTHVNATFADLVDGGSDVLLDLTLYEVDKSQINNLGVQLPSSVGVFPIVSTAQQLISSNQSLISQAIANNLITLTGNASTDALLELGFLLASGTVTSAQFTSLLGTIGHYNGLPLAGTYLGSSTSVNAALTSSEVRILDTVQLRVGDKQDGQFRAGTRYPIETGIYSSSVSSGVSSAVAGLNINGTSVSSLLSQYLGSSNVSVPQIQFEDLGLTLKATPQILRTGEVSVKLDLKIEALGSGSLNSLPILNNRQLTSIVTVPPGQSALLASEVNSSELRALTGLPFLSEIPGFQSTNKSIEKDSTELLITLTPHIVRNRNFHVTSRRLLLAKGASNPPQ